jgi:hypothetical protein
VGANRGALEQLGLSGAALRMHSLTTLFGTTVGALVDRFRSPLATPMPVHLNGGRQFHIHARFNWPVWSSLSDAVSGSNSQEPSAGTVHNPAAATAGTQADSPPRGEAPARPGGRRGRRPGPAAHRRRPDRQRDRQDPPRARPRHPDADPG